MYVNWGAKNTPSDLDNKAAMKTESSVSVPFDSSYNMMTKPSPKFQKWATPETSTLFTQSATAQNYHNAPSYYQNPVQTNFSPGIQFANNINHGFSQSQHSNQINWDQGHYNQGYHYSCRFHPYNIRAQERITQVSSSSPMCGQTLNLPTPSPSPNQCDKCGFVCDSAVQIYKHCNAAHVGASPAALSTGIPIQQYSGKQYSNTVYQNEDLMMLSDILGLDSQIAYQGTEGDQAAAVFVEAPLQTREVNTQNLKPFMHVEQKMYTGVQMPPLADDSAPATVWNADMKPLFPPYDSYTASQMTSTQPSNPMSLTLPSIGSKGTNLKSIEAKRPKTYNCTACNKWFTSAGHLKRHYNTTLHKNSVRSSGQPDPAKLPILNHHHPSRDMQNRTQQHSSESNILPQLKTHTLPAFSHLKSTETFGSSIPGHTNTPLCLGQNFQQSLTTNNLNGIAPHDMDVAVNNLTVANPATFDESPEVEKVIGQETVSEPVVGGLPSFAQLQSCLNVNVSNYYIQPNVESQVFNNKSSGSNVIIHSVNPSLHLDNADKSSQTLEYHFNLTDGKITQDNISSYNQDKVKNYHYGITIQGETVKRGNVISGAQAGMVQLMQIAGIKDYTNKENYEPRMKYPAILECAKVVNGSSSSVVPSSNMSSTPLAAHNLMKEAASTTVHKCLLCNKLFSKGCYLTQHNKTFHSGDKPYKCTICGKRFSDDYSFQLHSYRHSNNKPFKCEQCPKSFNHKSDLRRHMCLHSDNMPFSCDHCGKGFIRKDHMIKHVETHKRKLQASVSPNSISPGSSTSSTSSSQGFNITTA